MPKVGRKENAGFVPSHLVRTSKVVAELGMLKPSGFEESNLFSNDLKASGGVWRSFEECDWEGAGMEFS